MYSSLGVGAAITGGAGAMYSSIGVGAAITAGAGAKYSFLGAGAVIAAGAGAMFSSTDACAAITGGARATLSFSGLRTRLPLARCARPRTLARRSRSVLRDVLVPGAGAAIMTGPSAMYTSIGVAAAITIGAGARYLVTGAGAAIMADAGADIADVGDPLTRAARVGVRHVARQEASALVTRWCKW